MNIGEIYSRMKSEGYKHVKDIKMPTKNTSKYNGVFSKQGNKYFVKAFSGFKKKYLEREKSLRDKLGTFRENSLVPQDYFKGDNYCFLVLPFIKSKGTLEGKESNFSKQVHDILDDFHNLPVSCLEGIKPYKPIERMRNIKENLPNSYELMKSENNLDIINRKTNETLTYLEGEKMIFSHNDFNGDNMLLTPDNKVILSDFEGCSPNYRFEDISTLIFFNLLRTRKSLEKNKIYQDSIDYVGKENLEKIDFFLLYRGLRTYEYLENKKAGFLNNTPQSEVGKINKSLLDRLK